MRRRRNLENDCIALLSYVAKNRDKRQTWNILSEATGIPYETLRQMVLWFRHDPNNWALRNYSTKFGYEVRFIGDHSAGRIIDVEYTGISENLPEFDAIDYYTPEKVRDDRHIFIDLPTLLDMMPTTAQINKEIAQSKCVYWDPKAKKCIQDLDCTSVLAECFTSMLDTEDGIEEKLKLEESRRKYQKRWLQLAEQKGEALTEEEARIIQEEKKKLETVSVD